MSCGHAVTTIPTLGSSNSSKTLQHSSNNTRFEQHSYAYCCCCCTAAYCSSSTQAHEQYEWVSKHGLVHHKKQTADHDHSIVQAPRERETHTTTAWPRAHEPPGSGGSSSSSRSSGSTQRHSNNTRLGQHSYACCRVCCTAACFSSMSSTMYRRQRKRDRKIRQIQVESHRDTYYCTKKAEYSRKNKRMGVFYVRKKFCQTNESDVSRKHES